MIRSQLLEINRFSREPDKKRKIVIGSETLPKMNFYQISPNNI